MNAPIFLVSVAKNKRVYEKTILALARQDIEPELWLGVDGRDPIVYEPEESYDKEACYANRLRALHDAELGCYLSHYRLMKRALEIAPEKGWDRIVVLEDDIRPTIHTKNTLAELLELDLSYEIINMNSLYRPRAISEQQYWMIDRETKSQYWLTRGDRYYMSTTSYIITIGTIKKLLAKLMPIASEIDAAINKQVITQQIRSYDVWPDIFEHTMGNILPHFSNARKPNKSGPIYERYHNLYENNTSNLEAIRGKHYANIKKELGENNKITQTKASSGKLDIQFFLINTDSLDKSSYEAELNKFRNIGIQPRVWDLVKPKLNLIESLKLFGWRAYLWKLIYPKKMKRYMAHYHLLKYALDNKMNGIAVAEIPSASAPWCKNILNQLSKLDKSYSWINLSNTRYHYLDEEKPTLELESEHKLAPFLSCKSLLRGYMVNAHGLSNIATNIKSINNRMERNIHKLMSMDGYSCFSIKPVLLYVSYNPIPFKRIRESFKRLLKKYLPRDILNYIRSN